MISSYRFIAGVLLALLAFGSTANARPIPLSALPLPPIASVEHGEYRALNAKTGAELWRTRWSVNVESAGTSPIIRVREQGAGLRGAPERRQWDVSTEVWLATGARRLSSSRETRDGEGVLLSTQRRDLDFTGGTGRIVTVVAAPAARKEVDVRLSNDALSSDLLPTFLRVLPTVPGGEVSFDLVTREGHVIPMTARIVGREPVTTPAGTFDCNRIELSPTGWIGRAAKLLMPRTYVWNSVAAPHVWVKYQGLDGGLGSPEVVMELTQFDPPAR